MLTKKFYIPIGALLVAICAIAFFALRWDTPQEPIKVYKTVTPIKRSATPTAEARTISASMSKEEAAVVHTDTEMPARSEASEYAEFSRAELLERFPQYDFHSPESKENLHAILRNEKTLAKLRAREAELKRKIANQEAAKELLSYLNTAVDRLNTEYPDFVAFRDKYPDPQEEDFIREYPDEKARYTFLVRALEAGKIQREMADRILATPGISEKLSSRHLEIVHNVTGIDEISAALELLRSKGY